MKRPPAFPSTAPSSSTSRSLAEPLAAQWQDLGSIAAWERLCGCPAADYAASLLPRVDRPWGYFELREQAAGRVENNWSSIPLPALPPAPSIPQ